MIPLSLAEIAAIVDGRLHDADPAALVTGAAFLDSRGPEPGGLFAAFVGERVDGHRYAGRAVAAGAAAVLGNRPTGQPTVVVDDVARALQDLARECLRRLRADGDLAVAAVTGSQGKTSVKDMLGQVLAAGLPTVATRGSFNNELGLPLTVLRAEPGTRRLVLEMGARGLGHIAALCAIAPPDVAIVLNVGTAHLGEFGSREAIATAKGELVEALGAGGTAVLNADDPLVARMRERTRARTVTFGVAAEADLRVLEVVLDDLGRPAVTLQAGPVLGGGRVRTQLPLLGEHQAGNAAAVAAAALLLGVRLDRVGDALAEVRSLSRWRMELRERADGLVVVNDAYNANPESMAAALRTLAVLGERSGRRTVAVLGQMLELGPSAAEHHAAVGRVTAELGIDRVLVVGAEAAAIAEGSDPDATRRVDGVEDAVRWLRQNVHRTDLVLVKASRGARLERIVDVLVDDGEETQE